MLGEALVLVPTIDWNIDIMAEVPATLRSRGYHKDESHTPARGGGVGGQNKKEREKNRKDLISL